MRRLRRPFCTGRTISQAPQPQPTPELPRITKTRQRLTLRRYSWLTSGLLFISDGIDRCCKTSGILKLRVDILRRSVAFLSKSFKKGGNLLYSPKPQSTGGIVEQPILCLHVIWLVEIP